MQVQRHITWREATDGTLSERTVQRSWVLRCDGRRQVASCTKIRSFLDALQLPYAAAPGKGELAVAGGPELGPWIRDDHTDSRASPEIVKTKLSPPSPRIEEVLRPELLELLDAGSVRKLTLIGAPAGYGKTTLLSQWRRSQEPNLPFAWVSLDEQDNDPIRLWKHIIEALDRVTPEGRFGADTVAGLGTVAMNLVGTTVPTLINSLAELPQRVALVLDDYHWITKSDCHKTIAFLVEHLPQTVHLVISTRSDPPLGL